MADTTYKSESEADQLRQQAEGRLRTKQSKLPQPRTPDDTQRLIHELEVHQIELEMQNAALSLSRDEVESALERYTDLYDFAPVGYCTLDRNGTIRAANLTAAGLLGIERAQLIGRNFGFFVSKENRLIYSKFIEDVFTSKGKEVCELALAIGDDSRYYMRIEGIIRQAGNECRIVFIDINKRKLAEQENRQSRDRLDWVLAKTRVGMWFNELPLNRLSWDAMTKELFFIDQEVEPTIDLFWSRLHPDDREPTRLAVEKAIRERCPYEIDHRAVDPLSGEVRWIHSTGNAAYTPDGTPVRFDGINYDITALKRAEEARHEIEELNRKTLQALPAHIAVIDHQGRIIAVNDAWTEFASANHAHGSPAVTVGADYCHVCRQCVTGPDAADAAQALAGIESVLAGGQQQFTMEYPCHSPEQQRWYFMTVVPLGLSGENGAVITHTDISTRRQTEDALRFLAMYTENGSGENFLLELACYLAQSLRMDFVCIDRLDGDQLTAHTLAVFNNGQFEDNISYSLKDTPCADVVSQNICCFPQNVQRLFPNDEVLQVLQAECYLGTTLWSTEGVPIGLIAVIGRNPLHDSRLAQSVLQLVAPRAAGELESQLARAELRESEERFRAVASASADWIWEIDIDYRYTYASGKLKDALGYEPEEILGRTPFDLMPPGEEARIRSEFQAIVTRRDYFRNLPNINLHKNGETRHILTTGLPIFDRQGELCGYRGVDIDITERKLAEEKLYQSEKRLALAASATRIGIFDWNLTSGTILWTHTHEAIFGYAPDATTTTTTEHDYRRWADRVHPEDLPFVEEESRRCMQNDLPLDVQYRIIWPDGSLHWIETKGIFLYDSNGSPHRLLGVVLDITERKQADETIRLHAEQLQTLNKELQLFNDVAVGRELRMIELKNEINELCVQIGQSPRYLVEFENE